MHAIRVTQRARRRAATASEELGDCGRSALPAPAWSWTDTCKTASPRIAAASFARPISTSAYRNRGVYAYLLACYSTECPRDSVLLEERGGAPPRDDAVREEADAVPSSGKRRYSTTPTRSRMACSPDHIYGRSGDQPHGHGLSTQTCPHESHK